MAKIRKHESPVHQIMKKRFADFPRDLMGGRGWYSTIYMALHAAYDAGLKYSRKSRPTKKAKKK